MDTTNKAGVLIRFQGDSVSVATKVSCEGIEGLRGELMLMTNYMLRVIALVKNTSIKKQYLSFLSTGLSDIDTLTNNFSRSYSEYYKIDKLNYSNNLSPTFDREFYFLLTYTKPEGHTTVFKPKGFGLLGKNIDSVSMFSSLLLINFTRQKYRGNKQVTKVIDSLIKEVVSFSMTHRKIDVQSEWTLTESLPKLYLNLNKGIQT